MEAHSPEIVSCCPSLELCSSRLFVRWSKKIKRITRSDWPIIPVKVLVGAYWLVRRLPGQALAWSFLIGQSFSCSFLIGHSFCLELSDWPDTCMAILVREKTLWSKPLSKLCVQIHFLLFWFTWIRWHLRFSTDGKCGFFSSFGKPSVSDSSTYSLICFDISAIFKEILQIPPLMGLSHDI